MILVSNRDVWITTNYAPPSITIYWDNIVEARVEVTRINVLTIHSFKSSHGDGIVPKCYYFT
jgi:hypothetical protein